MAKEVRFSEIDNCYYSEDPSISSDLAKSRKNTCLRFKQDIQTRYNNLLAPILDIFHRERIRYYISQRLGKN